MIRRHNFGLMAIAVENAALGSWLPDELERYPGLTKDYRVAMRERTKEVKA